MCLAVLTPSGWLPCSAIFTSVLPIAMFTQDLGVAFETPLLDDTMLTPFEWTAFCTSILPLAVFTQFGCPALHASIPRSTVFTEEMRGAHDACVLPLVVFAYEVTVTLFAKPLGPRMHTEQMSIAFSADAPFPAMVTHFTPATLSTLRISPAMVAES